MAPRTKKSRQPKNCRRRRRRCNSRLPRRPKKPLTAYTAFVKAFFRKNKNKFTDGKAGIIAAAKEWRKMSKCEKRKYEKSSCKKSRLQFQGELEAWNRLRNALKQPPSAYALFLKAAWAAEKNKNPNGPNISIGEMGRRMSAIWNKMKDAEKNAYKCERQDRADVYFGVVELLRSGDMNIQDLGDVKEVAEAVAQGMRNGPKAKGRAQAEAMDESEEEEDNEEYEN